MRAGGERNDHLGVYRTRDGGKSWTRTLATSDLNGIQHLAWAPDETSIVFALSRQNQEEEKPAPGATRFETSMYKSTDEGRTWKKQSPTGLPPLVGRCTIAIAAGTHAQRLYLVGTFGFFRSDDGGNVWRRMAADDPRIANGQGEYTSGVYVDAKNPDIVYTVATCVYRSRDGGKTFEAFKGSPGGDDPQQMWIDPTNGDHILLGGDQGAVVSLDAGATWGSWYNQPTGQFYHIGVDNQWPYWVFGTQQDSNSIGTSSRGNAGEITPNDWTPHPGGEGGPMVADPLHPGVTYCYGNGGLIRVMFPSGQWTQINPRFADVKELRGPSCILFSAGDPHELLAGTQFLLSSKDQGASWRRISPDLTETVPAQAPSKGTEERKFTIETVSASPLDRSVLWAGTGNGKIELTQDHGQSWTDVSVAKIGGIRSPIMWVEASGTTKSEAYAVIRTPAPAMPRSAADCIYRTKDYGRTWTEAAARELPLANYRSFAWVLRSDPVRPGLLFLLTGSGIFFSRDDGDDWQPLNLNLPVTPFTDLILHGDDLVLATFGRGIWILDDYSPLRELSAATAADSVHLYRPATAVRVRRNLNEDTPFPPEVPHALNPPLGVVIDYSLAAKPRGTIELDILDGRNQVVRHMSSAPIPPYHDQPVAVPDFWFEPRNPLPTEIGLNRVTWNIRYDTPPAFFHDPSYAGGAAPHDTPFATEGPLALPGRYTARLSVDGQTYSQPITVINDPRSPGTPRGMAQMHAIQMRLLEEIRFAWDAFLQVDVLRAEVAAVLAAKPDAEVEKASKAFDAQLAAVGGSKVREGMFFVLSSTADYVGFNQYLISVLDGLDYGDVAPTESVRLNAMEAWSNLKSLTEKWYALNGKALSDFNALLAKHNLKPIPSVKVASAFPRMAP